ncbi:hypothetical protein [Corynebacterium sp. H130]|uniref:hypothetical protein n=1 Tax=Corynebacterium sp. H130 TaxID=3133444 RepID=UPI00309DDE4D
MTTPQNAQEQLALAQSLERRASGFHPAWITYELICGATAMYAMCQYYAGGAPQELIILLMIWNIAATSLIGLFAKIHPSARRGFGTRWSVMMVVWMLTWAATTVIPTSLEVAMTEAIIFLILAIAGPTWEALANR